MMSLHGRAVALLPGGYLDEEGRLHREAELAQLTGREEELLVAMHDDPGPILVTRLLARCVRRIGSLEPVTEPVMRRLLIADRQYLLLKLRELTFGSRVEGTLYCPWPQCAAKVDLDFSTADVPVKRCENIAPSYRIELSPEAAVDDAGAEQRVLTFRLPNGEDEELLAPTLAGNPAQALTRLLERCIVTPQAGQDPAAAAVARLSARARWEIEQAMEDRAPAVDLDMALVCAECGRGFTAPFHLQDFLFGELQISRDLLYRQVHYLAYHYHWNEREIMEMPRAKRLTYIDILAEENEALGHAF
jgi:hypothetical protein